MGRWRVSEPKKISELTTKTGTWTLYDDQSLIFDEDFGESTEHTVAELMYVIQEFQKLQPIKLPTDFSQWRGIQGA
jgi:hypothetical protein